MGKAKRISISILSFVIAVAMLLPTGFGANTVVAYAGEGASVASGETSDTLAASVASGETSDTLEASVASGETSDTLEASAASGETSDKLAATTTTTATTTAKTAKKATPTIVTTGTAGTSSTYEINSDGELFIRGTGEVTAKFESVIPKVKKAYIGDGITSIGEGVFWSCDRMNYVSLPNTLTTIKANAFRNTSALMSISIPNSIQNIGSMAFYNSGVALTSDGTCNYLGNSGNPYLVLLSAPYAKINAVTEYTVNANTKIIASDAFLYADALTTLNLPDGLLDISERGLYNLKAMQSLTLPDSIEYIGANAFAECVALSSVEFKGSSDGFAAITGDGKSAISSKVTCTGTHTHDWVTKTVKATNEAAGKCYQQCSVCEAIKHEVTYPQYNKLTLSATQFDFDVEEHKPSVVVYDVNGLEISNEFYEVSYPEDCVSAGNHTITVTFKNKYEGSLSASFTILAHEIPSGKYGNNISYSYSDGVLTFTGSGAMTDSSFNGSLYNLKWSEYTPFVKERQYITEIVIGEGITSVGDFAFLDFKNLTKVTLPSTLKSIGYYAFYNCQKLSDIELNSGLEKVKNFAFFNCHKLSGLAIADSIEKEKDSFNFIGTNTLAGEISLKRTEVVLDYLNDMYLPEKSKMGFQYYNVTPADYKILKNMVDDVTKDCKTDSEKVDAIGNFVASNWTFRQDDYDFTSYVLRTLGGVCAGHNQVVSSLLKVAGFPTAIISGLKVSSNDTMEEELTSPLNHQWAMTYYNGEWHIIDTTSNYLNYLATNETISKIYCCNLVDGVMPITSDEDIVSIIRIAASPNYYIDGKFKVAKINGIAPVITGILNNGAYWCDSLYFKKNTFDHSKDVLVQKAGTFYYQYARENGTKAYGPIPTEFDGKYLLDLLSFDSVLKVSEEFASLPWQGIYTMIVGDTVSLFGESAKNMGLAVTAEKTDILDIDEAGNITAKKAGVTQINVRNESSGTSLGIKVVDSPSDIITNSLIQQYCDHDFIYHEITNLAAASESNAGSYTKTDYCRECVAVVETAELTIPKIESIKTEKSVYEYAEDMDVPTVIVKDANGNKLTQSEDFTVSAESDYDTVGEHTLTVTFKNHYTGQKELKYRVVSGHSSVLHPAHESSCVTEGNVQYYSCEYCDKYFSDEDCTKEIEKDSWVTATKDHTPVLHPANTVGCESDGNLEYYSCENCTKHFSNLVCTEEIAENSWIVSATGHQLDKMNLVPATLESNGNLEYWICSKCGDIFADAQGETKSLLSAFTIHKIDYLHADDVVYNGLAQEPECIIKDSEGNIIGSDSYDVEYKNNTEVGVASATITFKVNYYGVATVSFRVLKTKLMIEDELSALASSVGQMKNELESAIAALEDGKVTENAVAISELSEDITTLTTNLTNLKNVVDALDSTYATDADVAAKVQSLNQSISDLETKLTTDLIAAIETAVSAAKLELSASIKALENGKVAENATAIAELGGKVYALEKNIAALRETVEALDETFATDTELAQKAKELGDAIDALEKRVTEDIPAAIDLAITTAKSELNAAIKALEDGKVTTNASAITQAGIDIAALQEIVSKLGESYATDKAELIKMQKDYAEATDKVLKAMSLKNAQRAAMAFELTAKITQDSDSKATLSWNRNGMADGYEVYTVNDGKKKLVATITSFRTVKYEITGLKVGATVKAVVVAYAVDDMTGAKVYGDESNAVGVTMAPTGTVLTKLTAGAKALTATWKKQASQTSGYELRYSTKSSMAGAKSVTISKAGTTSTTIKKLTAKQKYYVQVRTFKTVSGKKYYSAWSASKAVKVK